MRAAEQLWIIQMACNEASGNFTSRDSSLSLAQWQAFQQYQHVFESIGAWSPRTFNLAGGGELRPAEGMFVSGSFFDTLGVHPWRGRLLDTRDDAPGCAADAAVISYSFLAALSPRFSECRRPRSHRRRSSIHHCWDHRSTFVRCEVGRSYDVAIPMCTEDLLAGRDSQLNAGKYNYWLSAIGRLCSGSTRGQANAELAVISPPVFSASLPRDIDSADIKHYLGMQLVLRTFTAPLDLSCKRIADELAAHSCEKRPSRCFQPDDEGSLADKKAVPLEVTKMCYTSMQCPKENRMIQNDPKCYRGPSI